MRIAMLYYNLPAFGVDTHDRIGLGGSESGFTRTAQHLHALGHEVYVFNSSEGYVDYGRLKWANIGLFKPTDRYDIVYSLRHWEPFRDYDMNAGLRVLFLADTESYGLGDVFRSGKLDVVMAVSHWQKDKIAREEGIADADWIITSNGVDKEEDLCGPKVKGRCIFMGTPDRGLDRVLWIWPRILAAVPNATLHLYSSYLGWRLTDEQNIDMTKAAYRRVDDMLNLGVVNYRHAPPDTIHQALNEAEVYLYPTDFSETCCMSVLDAMYRAVIPVVTAKAGLMEKVINEVTGFCIPAYGSGTPRYENMFVESAIRALKLSDYQRGAIVSNAKKYAEQFTYDKLVSNWVDEWKVRLNERGWQYG
jgi:glycosyltransferase involved in cell wall biosynthesis